MVIKSILGFEGLYSIDEYGNVYSLITTSSRRKGIIKPYVNTSGYLRVNLYDLKGKVHKKYIHRLVAENYLYNPNSYPMVNHKDADKKNNHYSNLEWCTQEQNILHSHVMELQPKPIPTYVDGTRFKSMKEASLSIGLKPFRIAHERRVRGNKFSIRGHRIKVGDA